MKEKGWVNRSPVLRFNDVVRRVKSRAYAKVFIHRLIKQGLIKKLSRGLYSASRDVFSIASNIYYPAYLSFLSASYRFGYTETIPVIISVANRRKSKPIEFEGYTIEFIPLKEIWGYHKEGQDTDVVFVADVEKLMIDAFLRPKEMGRFEEILNVFRKAETIDIEKLLSYLKKLGSDKVYRQVGFLLEENKGIDIYGVMPIDRNYYNLNPFKKGKKLNKKWRLRI